MYCVIQELPLKKADTCSAYKQLGIDTNPFNRRPFPQYGYTGMGERFERPIRKAYKVSVHESRRVNGVVTKKQFVVTTINYYTLAKDEFALGDLSDKIDEIAHKLNVSKDTLYTMVDEKIATLQERIRAKFEQTEEYKTTCEHQKIISQYKKAKAEFAEKYRVPENEYDFCYDVFGILRNEKHLKTLTAIVDAKM